MNNYIKKSILMFVLTLCVFSIYISVNVFAGTNQWGEKATVTKVTESTLEQLIDPRANGTTEITERINGTMTTYTPKAETYNPQDRQWQGLPSISKVGNRLWAVWYTGGTGEPRQFNYLVIAYSDDDGQSWVDPFIIVDHEDINQDGVSLVVPNFFVNEDGKLCLIWIQYYTWMLVFDNAGAENIDDVTWQEPVVLTSSKIHKAPTYFTDSDGDQSMIYASEAEVGDTHIATTRFYVSKDSGETWTLRTSLASSVPNNRWFPESQVVQTSDDSLLVISRIEGGTAGGIEVARSDDYGFTWSDYENNLEQPFIGPGSKFHAMQLDSGNLLVINHDTSSARSGLMAYLSLDNGETFPYSLTIDGRTDVTYPSAYEFNGLIYVTWDKGRYLQKEIRFAVLTEADIIAGKYQSTESVELGIISKLNASFLEITSVNDAYAYNQTYELGTESATIRASLPTTLTVTDNQGNDYEITGTWKNPGYYQDIAGEYRFYFQTDLPMNLEDTYDHLSMSVTLVEKTGNNLALLIGIPSALFAGLVIFVVYKRRK